MGLIYVHTTFASSFAVVSVSGKEMPEQLKYVNTIRNLFYYHQLC